MSLELHAITPFPAATVYAIVKSRDDLLVYNGTTFETWSDGNITTYALFLPHRGGDDYADDFPAVNAGRYVIHYHRQETGTPDVDDVRIGGETYDWRGITATGEHYAYRVDLERQLGRGNAALHADLEANILEADVAEIIEESLDEADGWVNTTLALLSPPPAAFPVVSTEQWVTDWIRQAAAKYAAGVLLNRRSHQPSNPEEPTNGALWIAEAEKMLARFAGGIPGVTTTVDTTPPDGTFTFVPIVRDLCDVTGDENYRPHLWY